MQLSIDTQTQPCQLEDIEYGVRGMGYGEQGGGVRVVGC